MLFEFFSWVFLFFIIGLRNSEEVNPYKLVAVTLG